MKCNLCNRENLTERELEVHQKFFHNIGKVVIKASAQIPQKMAVGACPDCGATLFYEEGCAKCQTCGFSRCG